MSAPTETDRLGMLRFVLALGCLLIQSARLGGRFPADLDTAAAWGVAGTAAGVVIVAGLEVWVQNKRMDHPDSGEAA